MRKQLFFLGMCLMSTLSSGNECPAILSEPEEVKTFGELRAKAIRVWDKLLTWALTPKNRDYLLAKPLVQKTYTINSEELFQFNENYGYFSIYHPIVGIVTDDERDVKVSVCLLESLSQEIKGPIELQFSQDEILSKVLAYRNLKKGMTIELSKGVIYKVDEEIDLWRGMPAFGLVPNTTKYPPILLFRGTDLNLTSEKGWASVLSDLDINGPGHKTFLKAHPQIQKWLKKMEKTPPRLVGFSLGGVFVFYTLIYDYQLINKDYHAIAFNPPGISKEMLKKWQIIPDNQRPPLISFVNQGDFVSQIGFFPGDVWEISLPKPLGVIAAHVTLISSQAKYTVSKVDVEEENKLRMD